jgi:hypothetical protein
VRGPSARAPKRLYWLDIKTIGKLKYRQKGGGKFTKVLAAQAQQNWLAGQGIESVLYESKPIEWVELEAKP